MSFKQLGLRAELLQSIEAIGYVRPTPVQKQAIPKILNGHDILAGAQTGTGKTAAFTLPILHQLSHADAITKHPKALIITPTRELAIQIGENIKLYGKKLSLRSSTIYGGVGIKPQIDKLQKGVDILVATPGRLLDHSGRGTVDLSKINCLVLDEADRMLDMGFIKDLRKILKLLPKKRQNMLFSATYSKTIRQLADSLLKNPEIVEVAKQNSAAESVSQKFHSVEKGLKRNVLTHLIQTSTWDQVLVFTRTKRGANKLTKQLNADGVKSTAIHGDKSQSSRNRALSEFKNGTVRTLVATDVAARGIDIEQLPCVVNFDLPQLPEDYVHRIGRTGRAGADGVALSLFYPEEKKLFQGIEKLLKRKIPVESVKGFASGRASRPVTKTKPPGKVKSVQVKKQRKASIPGEWFAQL